MLRCAVHNLEMKHVPECAASTVAMGTRATTTEGMTCELRHPHRQNEYQVSLKEVVTADRSCIPFTHWVSTGSVKRCVHMASRCSSCGMHCLSESKAVPHVCVTCKLCPTCVCYM